MNQRELAERHETRKSKPEQHVCCHAAKRYLIAMSLDNEWYWYFKQRYGAKGTLTMITHCPWCGEKLPDRGRLVVKKAAL